MIIRFPEQVSKIWKTSAAAGASRYIKSTKNVDLSIDGLLRATKRAMVLFSDAEDSNFGHIMAIVPFNSNRNVYVITTNRLFYFDVDSDFITFNSISSGSAPDFGFGSDAVLFNGEIAMSGSGATTNGKKIISYDGSSFTSRVTGLTANVPRPLCVSEHQNYLAVGNGNQVKIYDTSYSLQATMVLDSQFTVTSIRWRANNLFIGTRNQGGEAKVFIWNGSGSAAQQGYGVGAEWVYSISEYGSSVALVTSAGLLLRFNGAGFDELDRFPVADTDFSWVTSAAVFSLVGKVTNRGMISHGDTLYINVDGSVELNSDEPPGPYLPGQPSGIYQYTSKNGLSHHAGFNNTTKYSRTPTGVVSNRLAFSQNHGLSTGDAVFASVIAGLTGLTQGKTYYAMVEGLTSFQVAASRLDAINGVPITIGGTPSTDKIEMDAFTSFGGYLTGRAGAVTALGSFRPNSFYANQIYFGGIVLGSDASLTDKHVLMSISTGRNHCSFTTEQFFSPAVTDAWQKVQGFIRELFTASEQVVVKYRTTERFGLPNPYAICSWTSATQFTVDSAAYDISGIEEGDEIEVTSGANQGFTAHITDIDDSTSVYVFTIDETMPVATGYSNITAFDYKKLLIVDENTDNISQGFFQKNLEGVSTWVQLKIEVRGLEVGLYQAQLTSATHKAPG